MKIRLALTILAATFGLAAEAAAQTADLTNEVSGFGERIQTLEGRYLKPAVLESKYKVEARFNDAKVAYFLEDYQRASVLFVDVASDSKFRSSPGYRESLYLLGDSLFKLRNFLAAKTYLKKLVSIGQGPFYGEGTAKLLEIAYKTRDFKEVDRIYALLQGGSMSPAMAYLAGKAFYEKKDYAKARQNFNRAAQTPEYALIATYHDGVTLVAQKKFVEASTLFEGLTKKSAANERDFEVIDLSFIALGRIAYELKDVEKAIDYYGRISRTSRHFDRALWEQTWTLVSKGRYEAARQNVDVLTRFEDPDPNILAEAQLLRADLSMKLEEFDTARADYETVINQFTPVATEMNAFAAKQQDLASFFGTLIRDDLSSVESDYLPPLVAEWAETDPEMRRSTRTLRDVQVLDSEVRDTFRVLDEINARLSSSTRILSFPKLAEGLQLGIDAESRLIKIRQKLLERQFALVQGSMSAADRSTYDGQLAGINALAVQFNAMPATRKAMETRDSEVMTEFDRLRTRLDRIGYDLDAQKAQLNAVESYLKNDFGRPLTAKEKAEIQALRDDIRNVVVEMTLARKALVSELAIARTTVGVGDPVMLAETALRRQYRTQLDATQATLAKYSGSSEAGQIQTAQGKIKQHETRLNAYYIKLNQFVEDKVNETKGDVEAERRLVESHRESIRLLVSSADGGAGVLAYLNFMRARSQFNEIVLRGDVGVIDVVWAKKEDMSTKIGQLFEDRTTELKSLQQSFDEVR